MTDTQKINKIIEILQTDVSDSTAIEGIMKIVGIMDRKRINYSSWECPSNYTPDQVNMFYK